MPRGRAKSITFNRFWYPGWTAWLLDGKDGRPVRKLPLEREAGPLARIVVPVPAGEGYILLRFEDTPLRAAAKWVTLLTLGAVVITAVVLGIRRRKTLDKAQSLTVERGYVTGSRCPPLCPTRVRRPFLHHANR